MKKEMIIGLMAVSSSLGFGFTPPSGNTTVMVNQSDVLVAPTATELINANPEFSDFFKVKGWQVNIDTTPSINPIDGYQTQLKTLEINTPYIDVSDILLKKINRGVVYYNGGSAAASGVVQTFPFSVCLTTQYLATATPSLNGPQIINIGGLGGYIQTTGIVAWASYAASRALNIRGRFVGGGTLYEKNIANFFDGKEKICIFVATTTGLKIYINGNLVDTLAWSATDFATARAITIGGNSNGQTISRVKIFNFDMSAEGAPYTIADYTAGIDEPPALHDTTATSHALLSLSDYTLNGQILDASGNGKNATVSGQVAGTHDTEIGALYKAFTGTDATASSYVGVPTVQDFQAALRAALNSDGTAYTNTYQYEDDITVLTEWTDGEFKVLDENGDLIYWVSTQWGAQMGGDYTTNDATDLNAKIFYTCPENEVNGTGKGREWIEYVHDDVSARTIYEHAQGITGSATPTIGGIIIQPNFSGTTVGGTSIQSIFGKNVLDAPSGYQFIYLKASPTNLEKTKTAYPIWRTIRPIPVQGGN